MKSVNEIIRDNNSWQAQICDEIIRETNTIRSVVSCWNCPLAKCDGFPDKLLRATNQSKAELCSSSFSREINAERHRTCTRRAFTFQCKDHLAILFHSTRKKSLRFSHIPILTAKAVNIKTPKYWVEEFNDSFFWNDKSRLISYWKYRKHTGPYSVTTAQTFWLVADILGQSICFTVRQKMLGLLSTSCHEAKLPLK